MSILVGCSNTEETFSRSLFHFFSNQNQTPPSKSDVSFLTTRRRRNTISTSTMQMSGIFPVGVLRTKQNSRLTFLAFPAFVGMGPNQSSIVVDTDSNELKVRMGWSFAACIPLQSISNINPMPDGSIFTSIGVHVGLDRHWTVNGSASNLVQIDFHPDSAPTAQFMKCGHPKMHHLTLSVQGPQVFARFLTEAVQAATSEDYS